MKLLLQGIGFNVFNMNSLQNEYAFPEKLF